MKILHTSDWHLDAKLEQWSRAEEHERFFQWLRKTLIAEQVDALVVSGDIFDSGAPGNAAYLRYTEFLRGLYQDVAEGMSPCKSVIIVAGNHDSPSFLQTSGPILELHGTRVVTQPASNLREMIVPLCGPNGKIECLCAAIPFLRERDVTGLIETPEETPETSEESPSDGQNTDFSHRVLLGIRSFYRKVTDEALKLRDEILQKEKEEGKGEGDRFIPIIATGHLFTAKGKTLDDDGVRAIHVGTLNQFPASDFPKELNYIALGHLHLPQIVDGNPFIRYSGSPIPIGFSETKTPKRVILIEIYDTIFKNNQTNTCTENQKSPIQLRELEIPVFHRMEILRGESVEEIRTHAEALAQNIQSQTATDSPQKHESVWVKAEFCGTSSGMYLNEEIEALFQDFPSLELVRFENRTITNRSQSLEDETAEVRDLKEMDRENLFDRFLTSMHSSLPEEEQTELKKTFQELLLLFDEQQASQTDEE